MITLEISTTETKADFNQPGYPSEIDALLLALNYAISHYKQQQYNYADYTQQQVLKANQTVIERLQHRLAVAQYMATPDLPPPPPKAPNILDLPIAELVKQIRELDTKIEQDTNLLTRMSLNEQRNYLQTMLDRQRRKGGLRKSDH